jgi:hypothetical protein
MIDFIAKTSSESGKAPVGFPFDFPTIDHFPMKQDLMQWCHSMGPGTAILISILGIVYLLYGWNMFKGLVLLNAVLIGGYIGVIMGNKYGDYPLAGGLIGAAVAGVVSWPLMKWAVAVIGGLVGAVLGGAVWQTMDYSPVYVWAGALIGLITFGLISFIIFRASVIMYTSFQGGLMLSMGLLGLAFKYPDLSSKLTSSMNTQPLMLPIFVAVAVVLGLIYQQTHGSDSGGGGK